MAAYDINVLLLEFICCKINPQKTAEISLTSPRNPVRIRRHFFTRINSALLALDYTTLNLLRQNHPSWRLLCAQHAPLVAGFLHRVFIVPNVRILSQADLVEALEDELFALRQQQGADLFPGTAQNYLNDWADNEKGWLRKFYPEGTDEPHFDLTASTEKALAWLEGLTERAFVGTESRLLTLFELLRQMSTGSQADPEVRIAELQKRRDDIDAEIERIRAGEISLLDDTGLKDRFQQFLQLARELLTDFREVEHNFRTLDRRVRERIALWEGSKGALLEEIMGERDAIADSDQGKSFRAFWDFLMSQSRQEELTLLLEEVLGLPPIIDMSPDSRLRRVHYDWLEAGEHTQRTVARLSEQLRRFLDDKAWLENRRIMDILHEIETHALELREDSPSGGFMPLDGFAAVIELPLERALYRPPFRPMIAGVALDEGDAEIDTAILYAQVVVDRVELLRNIRMELQVRNQVSIGEVVALHPLRNGLAELVAYLQLAGEWPRMTVDEGVEEKVRWQSATGITRQAILPRIILLRNQ
jgi:flagellar motility protein MotE (MotC chaperone)